MLGSSFKKGEATAYCVHRLPQRKPIIPITITSITSGYCIKAVHLLAIFEMFYRVLKVTFVIVYKIPCLLSLCELAYEFKRSWFI